MFASLIAALGGKFIDGFLTEATGLFKAYINKEITEAELREKLLSCMLQSAKSVEVAHAEALAKTYSAFMDTMGKSNLMRRAWAWTLGSQVFALFWYQWVVPFSTFIAHDYFGATRWFFPSPGSTIEWAYLLIGGLCGMGPIVLRSGPGAGQIVERLKAAVR